MVKYLVILALLLIPALLCAQTTVNISTTDTPDGQTWNNGTYKAELIPTLGNNPNGPFTIINGGGSLAIQTGSLSGTGTASIVVPANINIAPSGTQWKITVCPQATSSCFFQLVTVNVSSPQTLAMTPPSIRINLQTTPPPITAYTTNELTGAAIGSLAYILSVPGYETCQVVSSNTCTTWATIGSGGGGTPGGTPFQVQINNSGVFGGSNCLNLPSISSTSVNFDCDTHFAGLNPWIDVTRYNVRGCVPTAIPCTAGILATATNGNHVITVSTSSCPSQAGSTCFVNGDGITLQTGGAAITMSTPGAPTVVPSVANVLTGTRMVTPGPTGGTSYAYQVFAEDEHGGLTPASASGTTTTGAATLGAQAVNLTSCTRSNITTTCTTSSAHGLQVSTNPQMVFIQNAGDATFDGWYTTSNISDNTHFSFISSEDTRTGATTSTTGGTVTWWNCNHITWTAVTGAYRYWIIGRISGSLTTIGYSWPAGQVSVMGGFVTEGVTSWDDFGATMMGNLVLPWWIPSTPPASAANDNLTTTITSGAGTTSLTLATAPSNNVTSQNIVLDAVPGIIVARNAASPTNVGGLPVYFPTTSTPLSYVVNSILDLTSFRTSLIVNGTLQLNNTMLLPAYSKITGYEGTIVTTSSFPWDSLPSIVINAAYPGIHVVNGTPFRIEGVSLGSGSGNANNNLFVVQDFGGADPGSFYKRVEFVTGGGNDYMGIGLLGRGVPGNASVNMTLEDVLFLPGQAISQGITATPTLLCADCGSFINKSYQGSHRGMYIGMDATGIGIRSDALYFQGSVTPAMTFASADGNSNPPTSGQIVFNGQSTMDTSGNPLIWFGPGGNNNTQLFLEHEGVTAVGTNNINGLNPSVVWGRPPGFSSGSSTNMMGPLNTCTDDGYFVTPGNACANMATLYTAGAIETLPGYTIFVDQLPIAAPTATVTSGGTLSIGSHTFQVVPIWLNGGVGRPSVVSNSVTTSTGNQSVTVTWTPVPGGCLGYQFLRDGQVVAVPGTYIHTCNTSTFTDTGFAGGGTVPGTSGGSCSMLMPLAQGIESCGPVNAPSVALYNSLGNVTSLVNVPSASNRTITFPDTTGTVCIFGVNCVPLTSQTVVDTFVRPNNPIATGQPLPLTWTTVSGGLNVSSNTVVGTSNGIQNYATLTAPAFSNDQYCQVTAVLGTGFCTIRGSSSAQTWYGCNANVGAAPYIGKLITGTFTTLATGTGTVSANDVIRCEVQGGSAPFTIRLYQNGTLNVSTTDSSITSGSPGIDIFSNTSSAVTTFNAGNLNVPITGPSVSASGGIFSELWSPNLSLCTDSTSKAVTAGCSGNITGMTSGQVAIAGSANTITSSKALQGTDANVMSAGTVSGIAAALCTDTNGGATTVGCTGGSISGLTTGQVPIAGSASSLTSSKPLQGTEANILTSGPIAAGAGNLLCTSTGSGATTSGCAYNTQSAATNTNIGATIMVSSASALHSYLFEWTVSLTAVGVGCTSSTTMNMNAIFTDPNASSTVTELLGIITIAAGGNGTVGFVAQGTDNIVAKSGTSVQYSTTGYTAGTGCSTNPTYQITPTLLQLW